MFKEFRIGTVFEKIDTPKIRAKANDFPSSWSEEYCVPLLTAGIDNQGLARYAREIDCSMIIRNCISVSANGANSGATFYQPDDFAVLQDAYAVQVIGHAIQNVEEGLYLASALGKAIQHNHDWVNKAGWNKIKTDLMTLPVIENPVPNHDYTVDDIDWQYMQDRIAELEQDRIAELDTYLKVTGLDDYELTDEDKNVLSLSQRFEGDEADAVEADSGDGQVTFKTFKIGELFTWQNGNTDIKKIHINGNGYPVVSSGLENMGIIGCTDMEARILPANTITVDMFGNVFYRDFEYKEVTHARVFTLIPNGYELTNQSGLYITSTLSWLARMFSYNNMCSYAKIKDLSISLPVDDEDNINFSYMERYIHAIEKQAIADVVRYKDKVIATTKSIIADAA